MITHSSDYTAIVKAPVKTVRVKFYVHDNSTSTDTPVFVDGENSISATSMGSFNNSGAQKMVAKIVDNQSEQLGKLIKVDLEAKTGGDYETITLGYYTVFQVAYDVDSNISTIDLYDPMFMLSTVPYALDDDLFPCTVSELATILAGLGALTLDPDFDSLPNSDHTIPVNLWATIQNTSYRDVINEIAQTTGTTAVTSGQSLLFKTFTASPDTLTEANLVKFKLGQKWGNVNSVTLSRQPQQDNILLRDETDAATNGVFEVEIDNNEIMDDDRETMIVGLYDALVTATPYINFYNATLNTEGHGYYEVGDVVVAAIGGTDYPVFITEVNLAIDGGISETIKSVIPTDPGVNNTTSGGILKTLWNTEIKVDRQENTITSVVEQQQVYQTYVNDNFSRIQQEIDAVTISVQDGGGVNQILNSVGYSLDSDGDLNFWDYSGATEVSTSGDTASGVAGALSKNRIDMTGGAGALTQRVTIAPGGTYNLSFYAKKETQGVATVTLSNDIDLFTATLDDDTEYEWTRFTIQDFVPTSNYLDVIISIDGDVSLFSITDLMLAKGTVPIAWQQAGGEVANASVTFDSTGIKVKSSVYAGAYTEITPLQFAGYDNAGNQAFALNNDTTEVNKLQIGGDVDTPTHTVVFLSTGPNAGMNFVVKG